MAIQFKGLTNDLLNVLVISDTARQEYQQILEILKWKKTAQTLKPVQEATKEKLEDLFDSLFRSYLAHLGLEIKVWAGSRPSIFLREESGSYYFKQAPAPYFDVFCQDPTGDQEKSISATFKPILNFFIDEEKTTEIQVASFIHVKNYHFLHLIELSPLYCWDLRDLAIKPSDKAEIFLFAPVTRLTEFLKRVKDLAEYLGQEKMRKLIEAKRTISTVPDEFKEAAKGRYAHTLLELLGVAI